MITRLLRISTVGVALAILAPAPTQAAEGKERCPVENASGVAGGAEVKTPVVLETDAGSLNRTVRLGSDREEEVISLRVNVSEGLADAELAERLELVAEPFVKDHKSAESSSFRDITFSEIDVSGDGKRITFEMCIDAPSGLDAGKYTSVVSLDGPPGVSSANMTVTVYGKDGGVFAIWVFITALLSFLFLLYKGASEIRAARIAEAEKETDADKRAAAKAEAEKWKSALGRCVSSLGWLVTTAISIGATFGILWAAYSGNPAWGEDGTWASGLALLGTGLAAIGAKTILTPGAGTIRAKGD